MFTARKKIQKDKGLEPSEFEDSIAQVNVAGNRQAVVIHVLYRLRKAFRKIHVKLVRELEKKFNGKENCACLL